MNVLEATRDPSTDTDRKALTGNGPGGRRLKPGEMPAPMTATEAARMGELYEMFGDRMRGYAFNQLSRYVSLDQARAMAEDLTQNAWADIARRNRVVISPDLSDDEAANCLFRTVRNEIALHWRLKCSHELAEDFTDPLTCDRIGEDLCFLACSTARPGLTGPLTRMVDQLPAEERDVLLAFTDGVPIDLIGKRHGINYHSTRVRLRRAVLLLQLDNPELTNEPTAGADLPAWQRLALHKLSLAQREYLLRVDDQERTVLLLHLAERLTTRQIADHTGYSRASVLVITAACTSTLRDCLTGAQWGGAEDDTPSPEAPRPGVGSRSNRYPPRRERLVKALGGLAA